LPSAADYASTLLRDRGGVVSWKTLATVEPLDDRRIVSEFDPSITELDPPRALRGRCQGVSVERAS
jgi:hypothetical protein